MEQLKSFKELIEKEHQLVEELRQFEEKHPDDYGDFVQCIQLKMRINYTRNCMRRAFDPLIIHERMTGHLKDARCSVDEDELTSQQISPDNIAETSSNPQSEKPDNVKGLNEILDMKLLDLNLSVRAFNALIRAGVKTVRDIVSKSEKDLMSIHNLGEKSVTEIIGVIEKLGLHLEYNVNDNQ